MEKDELKNLLFLAELSPCAPVASALEIVLNKLNKVIRADPAEPTADDVDVVATSLLLCVQMHHVDFQLLSDVLAYFAAVLSSAYLTSNGGWSSAVLKYSSLMTEQFVDYLISGQCLQKDAEFRLVCVSCATDTIFAAPTTCLAAFKARRSRRRPRGPDAEA